MRSVRLWSTSILSTVAIACSSPSPPPTCETTVAHIAELRPTLDVPENVAKCLREKWTSTARACIVRAGSTKEVTRCMTGRETPDPRPPEGVGSAVAAAIASGGGPYGSADEAKLNLNAIENANIAFFGEEGRFVVGDVELTPAAPCCMSPGHRCAPEADDWQARAWLQLQGFAMTKPFTFRYSYQSDGQTYEARAVGDLDCDGTTIAYVLRGRATDDGPIVERIEPTNAD